MIAWVCDRCPPGTCPLEVPGVSSLPPTMDTPRGRHIADGLSEVLADVLVRLQREEAPGAG